MLCISSGMNFAQGMWFLGHSSCYKSTGRAWGLNSPPIGKMLFLAFVDRGWPQTEGGAGAGHGNGHATPISQRVGHQLAGIYELWLLVYAFFRDLAYI